LRHRFRQRFAHANLTILAEVYDWEKVNEEKLKLIVRYAVYSRIYSAKRPADLFDVSTSKDIIFIVFDITKRETYDFALECVDIITRTKGDGSPSPTLFLVANKTDLISEATPAVIDKLEMQELSRKLDITIFTTNGKYAASR
jgi:hypothetical protein